MILILQVFSAIIFALFVWFSLIPALIRLPKYYHEKRLNDWIIKHRKEKDRNSLKHIEQCRRCKYCDYIYDKTRPVPECDKVYGPRGNYGVICRYKNPKPYSGKYIEDPGEICENFKMKE